MSESAARARRPSRALLYSEMPRALGESLLFAAHYPWLRRLPRGEPHPVLVLPGFLASDFSTRSLRGLLKELGYDAHGWKLGRNTGFNKELLEAMRARLRELQQRHGAQVSLIGQSLGGLYAHLLAHIDTAAVRQLISLGSPVIDQGGDSSNASALYQAINGPNPPRPSKLREMVQTAPPVPVCAIYTRSDGVVHWKSSLAPPGHERVESVEVRGSHSGMAHNPQVMHVIADRLANEPGKWRPFQ